MPSAKWESGCGHGKEVMAIGRATIPWAKYQMATLSFKAFVLVDSPASMHVWRRPTIMSTVPAKRGPVSAIGLCSSSHSGRNRLSKMTLYWLGWRRPKCRYWSHAAKRAPIGSSMLAAVDELSRQVGQVIGNDGVDDGGSVGEMRRDGRRRDSDLPGDGPQSNGLFGTGPFQNGAGAGEDLTAEAVTLPSGVALPGRTNRFRSRLDHPRQRTVASHRIRGSAPASALGPGQANNLRGMVIN